MYALRDTSGDPGTQGPSASVTGARPRRRSFARAASHSLLSVAGLACLGVVVVTPLELRTQAALALAMFALSLIVGKDAGLMGSSESTEWLTWQLRRAPAAARTLIAGARR